MKAVGYQLAGALDRRDALVDIELQRPVPGPRDIVVAVKAVSVNPVDYKIRQGMSAPKDGWKVLGWDAAGTVIEVGNKVSLFRPGDEVFYAGSLLRQGTNSELHLVDERLVGHKPVSLTYAEAAALPLTSITAWEMLFDRLKVSDPVPGAANAILIIGGAGGVGSIAIQLARALTDLTVVATASRPETQEWVSQLGAHYVIDHTKPMAQQIAKHGLGNPAFVFSTTHSDEHAEQIADLIAPQGRFGLIDDPEKFTINRFKRKSVSVHWELMFTRSIFETADMHEQGKLLNEISQMIESGALKTTLTQVLSPINAANLAKAHAILESNRATGKIALEGF
jgi:zinc-binding alcohol dehydrogenase family protein